jgi:hypothetical protein
MNKFYFILFYFILFYFMFVDVKPCAQDQPCGSGGTNAMDCGNPPASPNGGVLKN